MEKNYIENCVLNAPGLAISAGGSPLVKVSNTIRVKANGLISLVKTTSDCPSLALSKGPNGVPSTDLLTNFYRIYTLLAEINTVSGAISYSWVHSADIDSMTLSKTSYINQGNAGDEKKVIVGHAVVFNVSGANLVPGTTVLDASGILLECIDQFGFIGM